MGKFKFLSASLSKLIVSNFCGKVILPDDSAGDGMIVFPLATVNEPKTKVIP